MKQNSVIVVERKQEDGRWVPYTTYLSELCVRQIYMDSDEFRITTYYPAESEG